MRVFLTATEFARIIGKDHKTVINWIKKGFIHGAKRVGARYHIPSKEVEVYKRTSEYPLRQWQK